MENVVERQQLADLRLRPVPAWPEVSLGARTLRITEFSVMWDWGQLTCLIRIPETFVQQGFVAFNACAAAELTTLISQS